MRAGVFNSALLKRSFCSVYIGTQLGSLGGISMDEKTSAPDKDVKDNGRRDYEELNVFGRYQSRLCILLLLSTIPNGFNTFQFLAIHYTPSFKCSVLNGTYSLAAVNGSNTTWKDSPLTDHCIFTNLTTISPYLNISELEGENVGETSPLVCTDWTFMEGGQSVVTEFGMICGKSWQKPLSVSLYMFGKLFGGLMGGVISDRFGRKVTFLTFSAWQYVTTLATSFVRDFTLYSTLMFLGGCGGLVNFVAAVLLGAELVSPKHRSLTYVYTSTGYSIGCMVVALLAYLVTDWRWYLRTTGLIGLLYIPYIWLIDESPRWLLAVGKTKKAREILRKIAKCNNMPPTDVDERSPALPSSDNEKSGLWNTCKLIARSSTLLKRLLAVSLSWATCSMAYYTVSLDVGSLGGNRFVNIMFLGVAELAATALFYFVSQYWGRRDSYMGFMVASGCFIAAGPLLKMADSSWLVVAMVILERLLIAASFCIIYTYTGELFPTCVRNLVMGICSGAARVGSTLAPFIIYVGHQTNSVSVPLGMAAFVIVTTSFYVILPKTRKTPLPQTVQEAKEMKGGIGISCRKNESAADDSL